MKKEVLAILSVALVVVIVGCGLWLGWYALDSHHQKEAFAGLSQEFVLEDPTAAEEQPAESNTAEGEASTVTLAVSDPNAPPRHDLAALQAENSDCVGWLTIPDTTVDYPVMFTPDEPERYLRREFHGQSASGGTPFLDGRNAAQVEGQNLIVYGHNMLDGSMFKPIVQYLKPNFRQTHQDIYLELGGAQYRYQVLAVLETTVDSPVYRYTDLSDPAAESDFRSVLFQAANLDVIHHTEGYLTLSTCGDWGGDTRVLVVAGLREKVD
ncbi:MAG: class B sortase [Acutalibacter sp.]